jgi:tetratricopeptide (TPR) repeat protein
MLSNAPNPNSIQEPNREAFRDRNANILRKLVAFVTLSQGLTIGFAVSPSPRETDLLIDFITHDRDCVDIDFIVLDFSDPQLHFLLEAIVSKLELLPSNSKPKVVIIRGLEHSIGVLGEYPPVLVDLNFTRDAYRRRVPYPILFILPDYTITRIARFAPDFWAWKSVEFQIRSIQTQEFAPVVIEAEIVFEVEVDSIKFNDIVPDIPLETERLPVSQERLDLLNHLLLEYQDSNLIRADLLLQRSEAYLSHLQYLDAKVDALSALKVYQSIDRQKENSQMNEANALQVLSRIDYLLGKYQEAEQYAKTVLEIRENQLGKDHPYVAASLNNLANLYKAQGRYNDAEPLYIKSLEIREHQLDINSPYVSASLNNLAKLYREQKRYSEAEPLYIRSIEDKRHQLGADHPSIALSLNGLAGLYREQGLYSKAEPLYLESLEIREHQLGKDHLDVATSLNSLARLYREQGRYNEAEPLILRSLEIREHQLGKDHPKVALNLNNLAYLRQAQGNYIEAKVLWQEALKIWQATLGNEHPHTQSVLKALVSLETILQASNNTNNQDI